jgi:pimeloyl-ACP methyl ester carboxylesterase
MPPLLRLARWSRRIALGLGVLVLLSFISLVVWARQVEPADPRARLALDSDDLVQVGRGDWIAFQPRDVDPVTGVVFYPGGKAEPVAYAPILRDLAARGFLVVLLPMPLNLALLAPERASEVMERFPGIRRWVIGGHGLGGLVACQFARRHPDRVAGLVLWASYPAPSADLSEVPLPVLSIAGTADGFATPAKIEAARPLLPPTTRYLKIAGGDHWNFGDFQPGRNTSTISREEQQDRILNASQEFLDEITAGPGMEL